MEALKLSLQYDNENGVVMLRSWVKNGSAGSVCLGELKKRQESLCLRKSETTSPT